MDDETTQIYDAVGGDGPFYALVEAFYRGVDADPILRPLYPDDLTHAKEHLALFLIQRFGGHTAYGEQRGHPRLRMRHVPFRIGPAERDAWLRCMAAAVEKQPAFRTRSARLSRATSPSPQTSSSTPTPFPRFPSPKAAENTGFKRISIQNAVVGRDYAHISVEGAYCKLCVIFKLVFCRP